MAGSLATFALIAEQFPLVPVPPTVFISRDDSMRHPRQLWNHSKIFQIACATPASARSSAVGTSNQIPQS